MTSIPLRVLIVDDETPARMRLRDLLVDLAAEEPTEVVGMLANGREALEFVGEHQTDLAILDIRMPVIDGVECARRIALLLDGPSVVFVTAYDEYAVTAFDLAAVDYLVKPVRRQRLAEALAKVRKQRSGQSGEARKRPVCRSHLLIPERGKIRVVPVEDVLFFRSDSKYTVVQTLERAYLLDEPLTQLEGEFSDKFLRVHRNCLVAKAAICAVEVQEVTEGDERVLHREVRLRNRSERLPVSRRLWPNLRQVLGQFEPRKKPLVG